MRDRLPQLLNLFLCLSIGVIVASGFVVMRKPLPVVVSELDRASDAVVQVDRAPEARLLGADVSGGIVPPAVQISGLVAGGRASAAVLSVEGRPVQSYQLGEELINGWQLAEVLDNEVVIERSGRQARIRIAERPSIEGMVLRESTSAR
jgi:general secretion pathway protein C